MKTKIWIYKEGHLTFWKEHGKMSWSRDIWELMNTIKDGYEARFITNPNDSEVEWK